MGNESVKSSRRKTPKKENELYPTHKSVEEMLNRGSDQLSGIGSPDGSLKLMNLDKKTSEDPHQQALLRMSADYLTVKAHKEKIEDENFTLREELSKMRRSAQLKEALAADAGIEFSQPEEIANRFLTLREKHRRTQNENGELKAKLRLYEADLIQNDSKQTGRSRDLEKLRDKFEKQESAIEGLSKKLKDQKKLEDLCREQEKIISKLEDLFSKTKISIDNRWRNEMEEMISMTRNRQRYDPQSFMGPHYANYYSNPMPSVPASNTNIFEDYEAERYRNRVLERQLQDINRAHAREKQGLVTKLEDLRLGLGDSIYRPLSKNYHSN